MTWSPSRKTTFYQEYSRIRVFISKKYIWCKSQHLEFFLFSFLFSSSPRSSATSCKARPLWKTPNHSDFIHENTWTYQVSSDSSILIQIKSQFSQDEDHRNPNVHTTIQCHEKSPKSMGWFFQGQPHRLRNWRPFKRPTSPRAPRDRCRFSVKFRPMEAKSCSTNLRAGRHGMDLRWSKFLMDCLSPKE